MTQSRYSSLIICCLAFFLANYDLSSINNIMPSALHVFRAVSEPAPAASWYLVALGSTLFIGGRLGDYFGHKKILFLALTLFIITTLLSSFASSLLELIIVHTVQAIASGLLTCVVFAIALLQLPQQRLVAIASLTASGLLGIVLAPLIDYFFINQLNWTVVFLSEAGFAVLVLLLVLWKIPRIAPVEQSSFDLMSFLVLLLLGLGLSCAVSAVNLNDLTTLEIPGFIIVLAILLLLLCRLLGRPALFPMREFNNSLLLAALLLRMAVQVIFTATLFFLILYLKQVFHYSGAMLGAYFLQLFIPAIVGTLAVIWFIRYLSERMIILISSALLILAFVLIMNLDDINFRPASASSYLYLLGFAAGLFFTANNYLVLTKFKPTYYGFSAGFIYFVVFMANTLSFTVGNFVAQTAAVQTVMDNFLRLGARVTHQQYAQLIDSAQNLQLVSFLKTHYPDYVLQKMIPSLERIYPHAFAKITTPYVIFILVTFAVMTVVSLNYKKT